MGSHLGNQNNNEQQLGKLLGLYTSIPTVDIPVDHII